MHFEFATAQRIIFGPGSIQQLPGILREFSGKGLLVTGRINRVEKFCPGLEVIKCSGEPQIDFVQKAAASTDASFVVAIGGGSVIDTGKAISALLTNREDIYDYLEVIGQGKPLTNPPVPFIAIPTTAGSGAEATRNAVLRDSVKEVKVSLRSPMMLPKVAIIDPELTFDLPASLTAATGMDALTQLIEPFVSSKANPLTDALCIEGITRVARALRRAVSHPHDLSARTDMSLASLFGGIALANAGLGAVHGFAAPIGGMFGAPHGVVCAALLPSAFKVNSRVSSSEKFKEVARLLTGTSDIDAAVTWLEDLCRDLGIPKLREYEVRPVFAKKIVAAAKQTSSMKGNPVQISDEQLHEILEAAL